MKQYSSSIERKTTARAYLADANLSPKYCEEMCRYIRRRKLTRAKAIVSQIAAMEIPLPILVHNHKTPHKPGIGPGKYPLNVANAFSLLLANVEANAKNKGFTIDNLYIVHCNSHRASRPAHMGRQRGKTKRSHVEVIVKEKIREEKK